MFGESSRENQKPSPPKALITQRVVLRYGTYKKMEPKWIPKSSLNEQGLEKRDETRGPKFDAKESLYAPSQREGQQVGRAPLP